MENNFDPNTGKPINEENESSAEQQITGDSLVNDSEVSDEKGTSADTDTSESAVSSEQNDVSTPETTSNTAPQDDEMRFDPMTGKPINNQAVLPDESAIQFDPMTGKPVGAKKSSGALKVIIPIIIVAAAVVAIMICALCGVFTNKASKVSTAIANTFSEQSNLVKNLSGLSDLCKGDFTIEGEYNGDGDSYYCKLMNSDKQKQLRTEINDYSFDNLELTANLTDSELQIYVPSIDDRIFTYNYIDEKSGYFVDEIGEDEIKEIDDALKAITSTTEKKDITDDYIKAYKNFYDTLKWQSADKETFDVDGKKVKCSGYSVTVTTDSLLDLVDEMKEIAEEADSEAFENGQLKEYYSELKGQIRQIDDVDLVFYIYKNKLACVSAESGNDEIQIIFHGGDRRTQNIEVLSDGDTVMELNGKTKGDKETYELVSEDSTVFELEYDYKTGKYEMTYYEYDDPYTVSGKMKSSNDLFEFTIDEMNDGYYDQDMDITLNVKLSKGAKFEKLDGKKFDLGEATESDFNDIYYEILGLNY